jgi:hypothetical protein
VDVLRKAGGRLRRTARAVAAAAAVVILGAAASSGTAAVSETVASGPARSLGEPAAAQDSAVSAVVATNFGPAGAQVRAWTRPARSRSWTAAGMLLPDGFGSSYDPAAAAAPNGPLLVVAGTAPPGESCITNGSVAIANVSAAGRLGPARLVSDQRGTGYFDDRPAVAVGPDGTVWVAWSQGANADACQNVGHSDQMEVAASHDGGRTFSAPVAMPTGAGSSAFGARLAPLGGGRVAVSWTETMGQGAEAVLVSVLQRGGQLSPPQAVLTGQPLPMTLPGATFYDFPAGDIAALPGGTLVVAAPFWQSGRGVIALASARPGGPWRYSAVSPPARADLLLPALGVLSSSSVRLVTAVHIRAGDHLGYDWADLRLRGPGGASGPSGQGLAPAGLARLTASPAGPGYFELGEETSVTQTPTGLLSSFVVAGASGATLQTVSWTVPKAPPSGHSPLGTAIGAAAAVIAAVGLLAARAARRRRVGQRACAPPRNRPGDPRNRPGDPAVTGGRARREDGRRPQ